MFNFSIWSKKSLKNPFISSQHISKWNLLIQYPIPTIPYFIFLFVFSGLFDLWYWKQWGCNKRWISKSVRILLFPPDHRAVWGGRGKGIIRGLQCVVVWRLFTFFSTWCTSQLLVVALFMLFYCLCYTLPYCTTHSRVAKPWFTLYHFHTCDIPLSELQEKYM